MLLLAALAAFQAFQEVLLTPPGQKLMTDSESTVTKLMDHFGVHLAPLNQPAPAAPAAQAAAEAPAATAQPTMPGTMPETVIAAMAHAAAPSRFPPAAQTAP